MEAFDGSPSGPRDFLRRPPKDGLRDLAMMSAVHEAPASAARWQVLHFRSVIARSSKNELRNPRYPPGCLPRNSHLQLIRPPVNEFDCLLKCISETVRSVPPQWVMPRRRIGVIVVNLGGSHVVQ